MPNNPPIPENNPQTEAKIKLGKILFFDPRLSRNGTMSCNSCHNIFAGGDDGRAVSIADGKVGTRNTPTIWNSAFISALFWDGRITTLEEQAKYPFVDSKKMNMADWKTVIQRLQAIPDYKTMFINVFDDENITVNNITKAIAAYERTLITPNSPYDRYVTGDKNSLTEQQVSGMNLFAKQGCITCHSKPNFSGPQLIGEGWLKKFPKFLGSVYDAKYRLLEDAGRYQFTHKEADKHTWRVPTLRNIALTAPYFHNGAVPTLNEAVKVMAKTQLNKDLTEQQIQDIVAFLNSLTGEFPKQTIMPRLPTISGKAVLK
ncbi:cytochrome c peroxidase [Candidatus Halobeggiatoa sp. HSG11]|nr:cytochrome c peroxidase [Candidatus Halobeggiatoa sp. HSG11]